VGLHPPQLKPSFLGKIKVHGNSRGLKVNFKIQERLSTITVRRYRGGVNKGKRKGREMGKKNEGRGSKGVGIVCKLPHGLVT
jgi:hypothetical protein